MSLKHFPNRLRRCLSVVTLVLITAVSVSAYTVVMRNGRRIDIGSRFVVTRSTITYEVSPGFQITLQMQAVDIAATEAANNEQPGALLRRVENTLTSVPAPVSVVNGPAARTITNQDLEASRQRRLESELAYEKRLKQLGLPSIEESRQRAALESEVIRQELKEMQAVELDSEEYWRSRATALRTEIVALDAEIQYVRARIDEYPVPNGNASFTNVPTIDPFLTLGNVGNGQYYPGGNINRRGVYGANQYRRRSVFSAPGSQVANRGGYGGRGLRGRGYRRNDRGWRGVIGLNTGTGIYPNIVTTTPGAPNYDYTYERSALITRFDELSAQRAGMNARWRELEEEARRAGAPPGWLR